MRRIWKRRVRLVTLAQITVLSLVSFTEDQLDKLRAVSPRLEVQQWTDALFDELPEELRQRVEILYGSSEAIQEAQRFANLKWIQAHGAGVDSLLDKPVWQSNISITSLSGIHPVPMAEHALAMMLVFAGIYVSCSAYRHG